MNRRQTQNLALLLVVLSGGLACADLIGLSPSKGSWDEDDGFGGDANGVGGNNGTGGSGDSSSGGEEAGDGGSGPGSGAASSTGGAASDGGSDGTGGEEAATGGNGSGGESAIPEPSLVTSAAGAYWQEGELVELASTVAATVTVDVNDGWQVWEGFGGTFSEMGWDVLLQLPEADRDQALRLLFDAEDGANFTWGRIPIGASEYALDRYTLNEDSGDTTMASFSIERDEANLLPYIHAALAVNPELRLWAVPWTPPTWMKTNGGYDRGSMQGSYFAAYALYFVKFIEAYALEGVTIEQVQPQTHPEIEADAPSCLWTPSALGDFVVAHLGPALEAADLDTTVMYGSLTESGDFASHLLQLNTAAVQDQIVGVGLDWGNVANVGDAVPFGHIMQTEHQPGNYPWITNTYVNDAPNDLAYAEESWGLIKDWLKAGVHSYMASNMVLDDVGHSLDALRPWAQNALLVVDRDTDSLIVTPAYYVFRHVAQYVEPGGHRVEISAADALAFENPDGSVVAILHNASGSPSPTTLGIGDARLEFTVPAYGWATVNWQN